MGRYCSTLLSGFYRKSLSKSDCFYATAVPRPGPDRERMLDVVQEGWISKLGVSWRARLIVPTCRNCKHLAYMSLLKMSRYTGAKETKKKKKRTLETRVRLS